MMCFRSFFCHLMFLSSATGISMRWSTRTANGYVILDEAVQWEGPDSYHAHPYPCPRICARLTLGAAPAEPHGIRIRAEGTQNVWDLESKPEPTSPARRDIRRAVATVEGNDRGVSRATIRALADRNVILIDQGGAGKLEAARSGDLPDPEQTQPDPDVQTIQQQLPGDPGWAGMSFAMALVTRGGRQAVAIVTSREATDPRAAAIKLAGDVVSIWSPAAQQELFARTIGGLRWNGNNSAACENGNVGPISVLLAVLRHS